MHEIKPNVNMMCLVSRIVNDFGNQHAALCFGPAKHFADEAEGVGLDAHAHVFALVSPDFFHVWVFGPGTDGDLCCTQSAPFFQILHSC
jgi:hypothetical protein